MNRFALAAAALLAAAPLATAFAQAQDDAPDTSAPLGPDGIPRVKTSGAPVSSVTVYPDGALVTRTTHAALPAGASIVVFDDLTPGLDEASLRAHVGAAGVRIGGVSADWQGNVVSTRDAQAKLEAQVEKLAADIQAERDKSAALQQRRAVLDQYRALSHEAIGENAGEGKGTGAEKPATKWNGSLAFLTKEQASISSDLRVSQQKQQDIQEKLNAANSELAKIRANADLRTRRVEVELEADHATEADIALDYSVAQASWSPAYDARSEGKTLSVTCFGTVVQATGEDWTNVAMTLSTARPAEGAQVPTITIAQLSGSARKKRPVQIVSYGQKQKNEYKADGNVAAQTGAGERVTIDDHGTGVTFHVKGKESVPADQRPHKVEIATLPLDAALTWEAIPKIAPFVFLKATAKNGASFPFLAGPVDVFRSSGYIGTGHLDYVAPGEEFSVSLGSDDQLKVHRVIDERVDTKPKLLGSTRQLAYGYSIEVSNFKDSPETLTLVENIPVSQRKEIKVALREGTTKPDKQDDDGFVKWNVPLKSGETKTIYFGYTVEYPSDFQIGGL